MPMVGFQVVAELREPRSIPRLDCVSVGIGCEDCGGEGEACSRSQKPCGHHCDHSWTHDRCCWCEKEWGEQ